MKRSLVLECAVADLRLLLQYRKWISWGLLACIAAGLVILLAPRDAQPLRSGSLSMISSAAAQQVDQVVPPASIAGALAPLDEAFALFAASAGLAQVEAARAVMKTTRDDRVRDYAMRMQREHESGRKELERIVAPHGLKLPTTPTGRHLDLVTKLSGVPASDVSDAYLRRFGVDVHKETLSLYSQHIEKGTDPELRRYAQRHAALLQEHMTLAQSLIHATAAR